MTGKEYLEQQVHPFGYNDKISTITYPEEDCVRCPFCGEELKADFADDKKFDLNRCYCHYGKQEEKVYNELEEIKSQIVELQSEYNNKKEEWKKTVYKLGKKTAAIHYMSFADQRAQFDSEIEEFTK